MNSHKSKPRKGDTITAQGDDAERDAEVCGALCGKGETLGYEPVRCRAL